MIVPKFKKDYSSNATLKLFTLVIITFLYSNRPLIAFRTLCVFVPNPFILVKVINIRRKRNVEEIYFNHDL